MLKANLKRAFLITLFTTPALWIGCSSPEEIKADKIENAEVLLSEGSTGEALVILEELSKQYPNDTAILSTISKIYTEDSDYAMAAFYLEQAHRQSPEDIELLYQTFLSLEAADQPATHLLEKLANQSPQAMTPELWLRLGQLRRAENKTEAALEAYLKGTNTEGSTPSAETATAIGALYTKLGNLPQAENWLIIAAEQDDPNALTALFGLLEIQLRQKEWESAEATIKQLDTKFPGAVDASEWKTARDELVNWRKAQEEMQKALALAEAKKKAAEEKAKAEAEAKAAEAAETAKEKEETAGTESEVTTQGKAQLIADLDAAEAMADTPAIESPKTEEPITGKTIAYDPNIAIEPADPALNLDVSFNEENNAGETTITTATETVETLEQNFFENKELPPVEPSELPRTIEELLADAEMSELDRDYKSAIRKYWAAIGINNDRAEIWNLLSRAYLVDGQRKNAETTALEAVRLEPSEVAYTLDYLRVAQRSKPAEDFLSELETAYDRFPASPEITLSLARAHERISLETVTARNLYQRFIDIAPNHPLVPEAREAVARLAE